MGQKIDTNREINKKYERLTVIEFIKQEPKMIKGKQNGWEYYYKCKCDCGNEVIKTLTNLRRKHAMSCGCLKSEVSHNNILKFAKTQNGETTGEYRRLYRIYRGMNKRCYDNLTDAYKYYGELGVEICDEWRSDYINFKTWAIQNGYKDNLTIDRINVNGNYEPSNCRWVDMKTQANNKKNNRIVEYKGESKTLAQWCEELKLNYDRTLTRLTVCHMTPEQAFELPKQILKRKVAIE